MDLQRLARQEEQWAEMLFGDQPDAVLIHRRGRVAYANGRLGVLLGIDPRALYGRPVLELYAEDDHPLALARLQRAAFTGHPTPPARHRLPRPPGEPVEVEVATLVMPMDGAAPLVVEVLRLPTP